jgi:hypothetical protein
LQYATDNNAIITDGGTKSGIMELVRQRASQLDQTKKPIILCVAPADLISLSKLIKPEDKDHDNNNTDESDKVLLDPNHSHFVLVKGNRLGDQTAKLFEIATALSTVDDIPVVDLLSGGGKISKKENTLL